MKTIKNTREYKRGVNGSISCLFNHPMLGEIPNGLDHELDASLIAEIESKGLVEELSQDEKVQVEKEALGRESRAFLTSTDWYVIRQFDSGEPIPEDIKAARAKARTDIK